MSSASNDERKLGGPSVFSKVGARFQVPGSVMPCGELSGFL